MCLFLSLYIFRQNLNAKVRRYERTATDQKRYIREVQHPTLRDICNTMPKIDDPMINKEDIDQNVENRQFWGPSGRPFLISLKVK